jgi:hypothetical protein
LMKACAVESPMPLLPPVTTATLPLRVLIVCIHFQAPDHSVAVDGSEMRSICLFVKSIDMMFVIRVVNVRLQRARLIERPTLTLGSVCPSKRA